MSMRKLCSTFTLIFPVWLALAACAPLTVPEQPPAGESPTEPAEADSADNMLSAQALMNATYSGIYDDPVALTDGNYEGEPYVAGGASRPMVRYIPGAERYGDLDGDGVDDAVVFLVESGGGSGSFVYVAAQLNQDGQPVDAGAIMVEDRTQVRSVSIENGQIAVEFTTAGPGDGACCPSHLTHKTYALQDGQLAEVAGEQMEPVRVSAADLDATSWRLVELGENQPVADDVEITITFAGDQISGSGGCNNYNGSFTLNEDNPFLVTFGPIAATRMLCPDPASSAETAYFNALGAATIWGYSFGDLAISYSSGDDRDRLLFSAQPAAAAESATSDSLTGVTWQWVGLTDPMQQVAIGAPDKYTLTFLNDGSLQIQADCNQATASYTATDDGSLTVTPGVTTLALCGPESRGEELIQKLGFAARYFFQDGHLFIDMMADGGTLEFQP
ncbi:MAG: META domain-containing protein [Caldilineaceae bacterium]